MKHFISLCVLLVLVHFSTQGVNYVNCPESITQEGNHCGCCEVTCSSATQILMKACAEFRCQPGKQIGYHDEDTTKSYPECCPHPICSDS